MFGLINNLLVISCMLEARNDLNFENESPDGVYGMHSKSKSDLHSTELIKLKIQGKRKSVLEFKKRFEEVLTDLDCQIMDETPIIQNRNKSQFFRGYVFIGMNRRKANGE